MFVMMIQMMKADGSAGLYRNLMGVARG